MPAGNVAEVVFGIQTAKGTAITPSGTNSFRNRVSAGWLGPMREVGDIEETTGTRLREESFVKITRVGGSPQMLVRPKMIGALLYGVMGAKAVAGAADPWTHTFTLATTQPWMTFYTMLGATVFGRYVDCKIVSLVIESTAGNTLRVTAEIAGITAASRTAAEATATVETTQTFLHSHGRGALLVEGVAVSSIDSFKITIATGVASAQGDDVKPDSINEGMLDITIETAQILQDFALWNRLHYGTATPADLTASVPDILELAGSPAGIDFKFTRVAAAPGPERSLEIQAPRVVVQEIGDVAPNVSGEPLRQSVTYKVRQPAAGSGLTAILKNGVAAYTSS